MSSPPVRGLLARRRTLRAADKSAQHAGIRSRAYSYEGPNFAGAERLTLVAESGGTCLRCGELDATVDHVIPLCLGEPKR